MANLSITPKQMPQAILFDWDGTLIDTKFLCHEALNYTLKTFGQPTCTIEQFEAKPQTSIRDVLVPSLKQQAAEGEKVFYNYISQIHLNKIRPMLYAKELIQFLHKKVYMSVVSNKMGPILRKEVQHLGWHTYFTHLIGSYDTPANKPDPAPLLAGLSGSNISPGPHVWFIGDSCIDIWCAHNAGCTPVFVGADSLDRPDIPVIQGKDCFFLTKLFKQLAAHNPGTEGNL